MRLVDADNIQDQLATLILYAAGTPEGECVEYAHALVDGEPTVEAAPVVHAHWILEDSKDHDIMECSACGGFQNDLVYGLRNAKLFKYCPNCGARMDKREGDDED